MCCKTKAGGKSCCVCVVSVTSVYWQLLAADTGAEKSAMAHPCIL